MDLIDIVYRYINRFINSDELLKTLNEIDRNKLSSSQLSTLDELIKEVNKIITTVPIEIDSIEKNRLASIDHLIEVCLNTMKN